MTNRERRHLANQAQVENQHTSKPHQLEAEAFCREHRRVILADDMGVGKTLPVIRAAEGRTIVLCPATTKQNWHREILRERPSACVLVLSGRPGFASGCIAEFKPEVDFIIVNFDIVEAWQDSLIAWCPETCITDEVHVCRNRRTARFQATLKIVWACNRRYLLSGTPIVNKPLDLVALINMLGKLNSIFGGWHAFVTRYCDAHQTPWCLDTFGASNLDELHEKLYAEKIMLRRMKHEVLTLPQKTRSIARITIDPADLTDYVKCERELATKIKENPALLKDTSFQCLSQVRHAVGLCKIKLAIARVSEVLAATEKLVAFAHHRAVRETVAAAFPKAVVLNTETKDRDAQVELFQTSEKHRLFITSPRIGGLGITLTAASAVLIVEFDFTSAIMLQGEDRVHRLGQSRHVSVEYLYANNTVDGFMLALINRKQKIFDQACDGLADPDYLLRLSKKGISLMAKKPSFTQAEKRIVEGTRRRVTMAEKIASKGRFSLGGEYFVSATVKKITPSTPSLTISKVKEFLAGVSHGTATALRKAGLLPYKGAAAEEQAAKQSATKATPASKRVRKAQRNVRRQKAASKAGIERGAKQRRRVVAFIEEKFAQHDRYLQTGRERLNDDDYDRAVHLAYEYNFDEERLERMQESYHLTAIAA